MRKSEEIAILKDAAARLGLESYCGPWLLSVIAQVEADITADHPPSPTIEATRAHCEAMLEQAKTRREELDGISQAKRQQFEQRADSIREDLGSRLRDALRQLERW